MGAPALLRAGLDRVPGSDVVGAASPWHGVGTGGALMFLPAQTVLWLGFLFFRNFRCDCGNSKFKNLQCKLLPVSLEVGFAETERWPQEVSALPLAIVLACSSRLGEWERAAVLLGDPGAKRAESSRDISLPFAHACSQREARNVSLQPQV